MGHETTVLIGTAASLGFFHTLVGPDHYLPFIVMSKSGNWSLRRTMLVTLLCGIGHVLSSVVLGLIGIALGVAVTKLEAFESFRGTIATWTLIAFGLVYFAWGLRRAWRNRPHRHSHMHEHGVSHEHEHTHSHEHAHVHAQGERKNLTPWILFTIFVFGPCEPLIPLLMYPAATGNLWSLISVTAVFGAATIGTMTVIVLLSTLGISFVPLARLERYSHALAGAAIFLCGMSMQLLGL